MKLNYRVLVFGTDTHMDFDNRKDAFAMWNLWGILYGSAGILITTKEDKQLYATTLKTTNTNSDTE